MDASHEEQEEKDGQNDDQPLSDALEPEVPREHLRIVLYHLPVGVKVHISWVVDQMLEDLK